MLRILIVEDEIFFAQSLAELLKQRISCWIELESSSKGALATIDRADYDIYLIDLLLPDCRGTDLVIKLHRENPTGHFILMSAYPNLLMELKGHADFHFDFLEKPFEMEHLIQIIKHQTTKTEDLP